MNTPFFQIWNTHYPSCGEPPTVTNEANNKYCGYFQNRFSEQWLFVYDSERKTGELRGGDIGWDTVIVVKDGKANVALGTAEAAWLQACWTAATGNG